MSLSYDVISEFVKITNDKKEKPKEETVYATIVQTSDGKYVKIDGSDLVTPTETTTDIEDGERVTVLIKDHSAIITGNISSPSASTNRVNNLSNVVNEKIGVFETVIADKVDTNELHAYKAEIEHLIAGKAEIDDLKANTAEIKILNAEFANIKTLVNGNLTSDNILAFHITSDKVTMEDAFIKDAMIATVNAAKINAGQINTNTVSIGSSDGSMLINGSTQQFKDKNGNVRIQIGKDSTGDFTFVLYGEDGEGQIINQNGITASAVSDGLIVNDMVNDNAAISGGKLDISSVIAKINEDNSTTIESSKIFLDQENQSLEVAFGSLKTHVDTIQNESIDGTLADVVEKTQSNLTQITANTEGIKSLVSQSEIAKSEINDMKNSFQSTTTELSNKYTTLSQSLDGFKLEAADTFAKKTTVEDLENNLATNYTTTENMNSAIEMTAERVALSVSEARIKDIKLGGVNLLLNSDVKKQLDVPESGSYNHISYQLVDEYSGLTLDSDRTFVLSFIADRIDNLDLEGWDSISLDEGWHHRWLREDLDKLIHIKDQTFKFVMKPKTIPNGTRLADKLAFISENGYGGSIIYNAMLVEGDTAFDWQPAYSDIKTKMSQIEVNADSIATSVAKQEVENLKIGGTNLYNNTCKIETYGGVSNLTRTETGFSFLGVESNDGSVRVFNLINSPGWYTVSFEVKNNHEPWDMFVEINDTFIGKVVVPNDYYRYASFSYYVPEGAYTDYFSFVDFEGLSAQTYDIRNFKVEKGNKATDYSPSFTDITNSIARIEVKADEINSSVSSIRNGLTNENLLVGSFDYTPTTYWYQPDNTGFVSDQKLYDCKVWYTETDWSGMKVNLKYLLDRGVFEVDKPCTFSMYARTSSGTCKLGAYMHHWSQNDYTVTTQWKQFSFTFTPTQSWINEITDTNTMRFEPYELSGTGIRLYGACYKLERGTIATPWATNSSDVSIVKQHADSITSEVVSSISTVDGKVNKAQTQIDQQATQISSKVDANGVKSIIQQNPESVRIGFNAISNYFDLNSTRLQVGHSDGSYTQIGQNGIVYYDAYANWKYHSLMKQGWLGDISGTTWSRTITLPPSFKNKVFSVIVSIEMVNAVNTHDVIKHYKVTVPQDTVNYANGTFVINMSALAYYVPGQGSATAITTNVSWIAIA